MFSNLKISRRLIILISVLTLTFLTTGAVTLVGLNQMTKDVEFLNSKTSEAAQFARLSESVRYNMVDLPQQLSLGLMSWDQALAQLEAGSGEFELLWNEQRARIAGNPAEEEFLADTFSSEVELARQGFQRLLDVVKRQDPDDLYTYLLIDLRGLSTPFLDAADAMAALGSEEAAVIFAESSANATVFLISSVLVVLAGLAAAIILGPMIYLSITSPIKNISAVVGRVAQGDLEARTELATGDELGELGRAFDNMLDDRVSTMAKASEDNEKLNNSVIDLLEAVSELSNRDLTVHIPIAEDVTGPVADAMNLMTTETARVLSQIRQISNKVAEAASMVEDQGGKINQLADLERQIIEETLNNLDKGSKTMVMIAKQAQNSNDIATRATTTTQEALDTVSQTAQGMNEIRETIAETEKRIKRLSERSQEINGVVEIINNIAERTHILSLNASMQAAAAGDAGRGFAVVANEVQRLAESSRDSTSEIASLVNNIQVETAETMAAMNRAISQVIEGTELAQASGVKMQATQETTAELVSAVEQIAERSMLQARFSRLLRSKTEEAKKSTEETNSEIKLQADQATNLVSFSRQLLDSVNVFKLPEAS